MRHHLFESEVSVMVAVVMVVWLSLFMLIVVMFIVVLYSPPVVVTIGFGFASFEITEGILLSNVRFP